MHNVRRAFAAKIIALTKDTKESAKAAAVQTVELVRPTPNSPDKTLSELFDEVQTQQIYGDGKAFVDNDTYQASSDDYGTVSSAASPARFRPRDLRWAAFFYHSIPGLELPTDRHHYCAPTCESALAAARAAQSQESGFAPCATISIYDARWTL